MPGDVCAIAVKEFYANSRWDDVRRPPRSISYTSWYRGVEVDYSLEAVREFPGLPTEREDFEFCKRATSRLSPVSYEDLMEDRPLSIKAEMKKLMVRPGRNWKESEDGESIVLKQADMRPLPRVWAHFIQDTVILNSHKCEVRKPVLLALYCILKDLPMYFPCMISERILHYYNRNLPKEKPRPVYPAIITGLIWRAVMNKRSAGPF